MNKDDSFYPTTRGFRYNVTPKQLPTRRMLNYLNDLLATHGLGAKYLHRRTGHDSVEDLSFGEVRDLLCTFRRRRKPKPEPE